MMGELTAEESAIHDGLVIAFRKMGFVETECHLLAAAQAEPHDAQKLLLRGCTHALATRILM